MNHTKNYVKSPEKSAWWSPESWTISSYLWFDPYVWA